MGLFRGCGSGVALAALLVAGCGSSDASTPMVDDAGAMTTAAGGTGGSLISGAGGAAGNPAAGAGGSSAAPHCTGPFGAPSLAFVEATTELASPSVTADELELYLVDRPAVGDPERFIVARRASRTVPFGPATPIAELNARCPDPRKSIDVTDDGLRAYLSCGPADSTPQTVYFAHRSGRGDPFVVDSQPVASNVGLSFAVSADELVAYSSATGATTLPLTFHRSSTAAAFGSSSPALGPGGEDFIAPDVSNDDLLLFGAQASQLSFVTRAHANDPWGSPTQLPLGDDTYGAPVIAASCRTVYFLHVSKDGVAWSVEVLAR